jgi:hypothetical protein
MSLNNISFFVTNPLRGEALLSNSISNKPGLSILYPVRLSPSTEIQLTPFPSFKP